MRDKHAFSFGAIPAHEPERPSEPRLSSVRLEEGGVEKSAKLQQRCSYVWRKTARY